MLAIGIVAHPTRHTMAEQLADKVGANLICIDDRGYGAEQNHYRTWTALLDHAGTHAVVVEDDAIPVHDCRHQLEQAIKASPTPITSLYLGRLRPPQYQKRIAKAIDTARHDDAHYITSPDLIHAVAVALPATHIADMLAFTATRHYLPWDETLSAYAHHLRQPVAYTHPSLVDHKDTPTLVQHRDRQPRTPGRVAWRIGTRHTWDSERTVAL